MKIQLLSDLHLEAHPQWRAQPTPGVDALILAGDIGSYQRGSTLADPDFGLTQFSPLHGWPCPVFYVPGNHEYDGMDFDQAHARLQTVCQRLGITWLERQALQVAWRDQHGQPVRLLGTTLWTDFDAFAGTARTTSEQIKVRDKAFKAANYYLRKTDTTRHGEPYLAAQLREQALQCQDWLRTALATPFVGSTVVVTHFAPSLRSADPRYGLTSGTAGFCNALDDLLASAQLWLHGHLHAPSDYLHGQCRVVANPLGYARKNEQAFFQPQSVVVI
jgi:predicted phosphodiesterase